MVRVVSLLGKASSSRKTRTKFKASAPLQTSKDRYWIVFVWIGIVVAGGALLSVAFPYEKSNVILLPTEEGPQKVLIPASEALIVTRPEVYLLTMDSKLKKTSSLILGFSLLSE
jgi:hypothetical protein